MAMTIESYNFEGPFQHKHSLQNRSGVYAIYSNWKGSPTLLDIGESGDVYNRIKNHDRESCWHLNLYGDLEYYVLYTDENSRYSIEQELRKKLNPPCGER